MRETKRIFYPIQSLVLMLMVLSGFANAQTTLWTEGMENSGSLPTGWATENNVGTGWQMSSSDAKSGSYCARHRWASSSSNYIFTKAVTVTSGNEYELQYYTRAYSASFPESFYVKVGTAQTGASQSTTISTESNITSTSYVSKTATWIATFSGTAYFSFHCTSDDEFYLYLDDVTLTETSSRYK